MFHLLTIGIFLFSLNGYTAGETETRKTHLEDIFIWKMSDELKLTAHEEKDFTEISKILNKNKSELNHKIQEQTQLLTENSTESELKQFKKLLQQYNEISIVEFDSIKKLLGPKKFINYIKIKSELNSKMKSILIGEKIADKKENISKLPAPKVIVERGN